MKGPSLWCLGGPGSVGTVPAEKLPDAASLIWEASVNRSPLSQAAAIWRRFLEGGIGQVGVPGKMAAASLARHGVGDLGGASIVFNVERGWSIGVKYGVCARVRALHSRRSMGHFLQGNMHSGRHGRQNLSHSNMVEEYRRCRGPAPSVTWTLGKWKLIRKVIVNSPFFQFQSIMYDFR